MDAKISPRITHSQILDGCATIEDVTRVLINTKALYDGGPATALQLAVLGKDVEMVIGLLDNYADLNKQDADGKTPLRLVCSNTFGPGTVEKMVR